MQQGDVRGGGTRDALDTSCPSISTSVVGGSSVKKPPYDRGTTRTTSPLYTPTCGNSGVVVSWGPSHGSDATNVPLM